MRSSHRKSRLGCKECKKRHIKCDETQPSCRNCAKGQRACSFIKVARTTPMTIQPRLYDPKTRPSNDSVLPRTPDSQETNPAKNSQGDTSLHGSMPQNYNLIHLELLHHFEHIMAVEVRRFYPMTEDLMKLSLKEAFTTSYLMDEMLALAAAHKSTLPDQPKEIYRNEAVRLQTRSLAKFNSQAEITADNATAAFLFTTFLGQHVLFDIFSTVDDLMSVLDRFVHFMKLHQGIYSLVKPFWADIQLQSECEITEWVYKGTLEQAIAGRECAPLLDLINRSDISQKSRDVHLAAIEALQNMFEVMRCSPTARMSAVHEWPTRLSLEFIDYAGQRRPEALVVLSYYAVLLHHAREFWIIKDAGRRLVCALNDHLGQYWATWLKWPNEMISRHSPI